MPTDKDISLSNQIYKSRDQIRSQIIDYMRSYLELENVDLTKSTFLSFMVNTLATLTSNLMFYQSSVYREFFLTKAQLSESIYSISTFLGYDVQKADYATVNLLFTVPLEFDSSEVSFTIPKDFKASAGDIEFTTDYLTTITVKNNSTVDIKVTEDNRSYKVPVDVDKENNECSFLLEMSQLTKNEQEFQIEDDIQSFQFTNIDVPLESQLSDLNVFIKPPNSSTVEPYEEYSSLFLMGSDERGFVQRKIDEGVRIYFGNGLIGHQPEPGSTVIVETIETEGADGNVIPGSIKTGDRIYVDDDGNREILNYSVTNPVSPQGGKDEESIEEIRHNSIANLSSMGRLVSDDDYSNFKTIMEQAEVPSDIFGNVVTILKRSDLKVNEIQTFLTLYQEDHLIPSRNEIIETTDTYVPRDTVVYHDDEEFVTGFDLFIDPINQAATYFYYIDALNDVPSLDRTYNLEEEYDLIITKYDVEREGDDCIITINYHTDEDPCTFCDDLTCKVQILEVQTTFEASNDPDEKQFILNVPFDDLPEGNITLLFDVYIDNDLYMTYSNNIIFKRNFGYNMMSNVVIDSTNSEDLYIIYDVPVVKKSYLTDENRESFEKIVLQGLVGLDFSSAVMITDFLNLKLANTVGKITNMLKNKTQSKPVISIIDELPDNPSTGDRYIYDPTGEIINYRGDGDWDYNTASNNSILYVEDLEYKVIFTGDRWIKPEYKLPLNVEIEAFIEESSLGSESGLVENIKDELLDEFESRFGPQMHLYKSEIVNIVHNIDGVKFCHVTKPESDIFFNYKLEDFTQDELLEYTPELVHFTRDTISVRIFRG